MWSALHESASTLPKDQLFVEATCHLVDIQVPSRISSRDDLICVMHPRLSTLARRGFYNTSRDVYKAMVVESIRSLLWVAALETLQ